MKQPAADPGVWLESHRPYLMLLARTHRHAGHAGRFSSSDIVQQTLLDAFAKREQLRGFSDGEVAAWLRQILLNNLANAIRDQQRDKRDVRRERSLEGAIQASFSHTDQWLAAVQSSPSQRVVKQEDLLQLAAALNDLPPAQRDAIVLHHLQGLKLAEVALELGKSEGAVAGLLFRGLKALQNALGE
jgi:RNA polymerase sigma-70 factor (ECF subfamily)